MPLYEFKAYEVNGARIQDTLEADTEKEAFRRLAARGLTVAALKQIERRTRSRHAPIPAPSSSLLFWKKLKQDDIVVLCRELSIMVEAGVSVTEALTSLEENATHPTLRAAIQSVNHEISNGESLSSAMRGQPRLFPTHFCDIVRSAEEGGRLSAALDTGASQMEHALELRRKVVSAMLYPCLLLAIACITAGILVTFVLPRFGKIFQNMGTKVPTTTQMLLETSYFLHGHWPVLLGGLVGSALLFRHLLKRRGFATGWLTLVMKMPLIGDIIRKLAVSRSLAVLSSMLNCNVPLLSAIRHAAKISGNFVIEDGLNWVGTRVEGGRSFAESLADIGVMPHIVVQMAQVGERTGELGSVMGKTARFFESEVDNRLKSLTSIIEPVMIVGLGVFIGFITLSVITPIYSLVGSVK